MKLNFNAEQGFVMPSKLYHIINAELANITNRNFNAEIITLNFRDFAYSADEGGYHPVEIRIKKELEHWILIYATDFGYNDSPAELIKEIDVCFESKRVYSLYGGWLDEHEANELITLFVGNFIIYHEMEVYDVSISFE